MENWVKEFSPYEPVDGLQLRSGTVLRKVPFPAIPLGDSTFFDPEVVSGEPQAIGIEACDELKPYQLATNIRISPGIVISADCDIFNHKTRVVVVAQILPISTYIEFNPKDAKRVREAVSKAQVDPSLFNSRGLVALPGNESLGFEDSVVLLDNFMSLIVAFPSDVSSGFDIDRVTVGYQGNMWFRVSHDGLRMKVINEFARHLLRVGLQPARSHD